MKRSFRIIIVVVLSLSTLFLAGNEVAWATPTAKQSVPTPGEGVVSLNEPSADDDDPGTVKPPPSKVTICKKGVYSLGGNATLKVTKLAKSYCLKTYLKKRSQVPGKVPDGAGKIWSDAAFVQILYRDQQVSKLPEKSGNVQICFAVRPGKQVRIYYLNAYGNQSSKPTWRPVQTHVKNGVACADVRVSGAYALIGK